MNTDFPENSVILTGRDFNFVKGSASTNHSIEIAKAYEALGFVTRIIPQNPSLSHEETQSGSFCNVPYAYPLKRKNIFSGYGGWRNSLNFRLGVLVNPLVTGWVIWRNRKNVSHVFSLVLMPMTLLIIALACKLSRVPLIYHFVEEPWTLEAYNDTAGWRRLGRLIQSAGSILLLYVVILRIPSVVACITEELIRLLRRWGYKSEQLYYLPNVRYLNEANITESDLVSSPVTPFVMYSGQISSSKESFGPLLKAISKLNKRQIRVKLNIYGGGDPHAINRLKRMIVDLEVSGFVDYCGFVSRKELLAAQQATILCLLLKRDVPFNRYNFPTKLMDYLGAGKAVLMSNLPLHQRYFTDKVDSLIVNPESVEEIQQAIEWALEHPSELDILGKEGSRKLKEHFDAEANVKSMLEYALIKGSRQEMGKGKYA